MILGIYFCGINNWLFDYIMSALIPVTPCTTGQQILPSDNQFRIFVFIFEMINMDILATILTNCSFTITTFMVLFYSRDIEKWSDLRLYIDFCTLLKTRVLGFFVESSDFATKKGFFLMT